MSDPQKYVFTNNQRRILFIISAILVAVLVIISVLNSIQIHELNIDIKYFTPNNIYITSIFLFLSIILYSLRFLKKTSKMNPENIHDLLNNPIHEKLQAMEDSWNKNARWISYLGIAALGWLLMSNHDASFTARCWIISSIILFSISLFFSCIS